MSEAKEAKKAIAVGIDGGLGDIVYAVRPGADGEHGGEMPTSRVKGLSIRSIFFLGGPNVKEGLHLKGMAYLT